MLLPILGKPINPTVASPDFLTAKPFPFTFNRALRIVKSKTSEAAVIGDQVFMDILGGNLSKIYTILVKPISKEKMRIRKFMRWLEKKALNLKL